MEDNYREFEITFRGSYVHVQHEPDYVITLDSISRLYKAIGEACRQYNCYRVLAEGGALSRKMNMPDAFESGSQIAQSIAGLTMAICLKGYKPDELTTFFKTVARNRGATVEFFQDTDEALKWLGVQKYEKKTSKGI